MSCLLPIFFRHERFLTTSHIASRILDTICEGELVTAREVSISPNPPIDNPVFNIPRSKQAHLPESGGPCRIQIRLVTAQLARDHVRATLKDNATTIDNIFAFDGAFINGNTSLVTIRCIACTGISDAYFFRLYFDAKPLVHWVGSQKMI